LYPRYPLPWKVAPGILLSAALDRKRSFREDALRCLAQGQPEIRVTGRENIPTSAPALLVFNHYSRSGFQAYWIALAVSAMTNPTAQLAMEQLKQLQGCEVHSTHIPTPGDEEGLRKLGVNLTSDPNFSSHSLFVV